MDRRPPPPPGAPPPGYRSSGGPGQGQGMRPRPPPPNQPPPPHIVHDDHGERSHDRFAMGARHNSGQFRRSESLGAPSLPRTDSFGARRYDNDGRPGEKRFGSESISHRGVEGSTPRDGYERAPGDWAGDKDRPMMMMGDRDRDRGGGYDRERFGPGKFNKDIRGGPPPPGGGPPNKRPPPPPGPPPSMRRQASDPGVSSGQGSGQWGARGDRDWRDDRPSREDDNYRRGIGGGYRRRDDEDRHRGTMQADEGPREIEPGEVIEEGEIVPAAAPVEQVMSLPKKEAIANAFKKLEIKVEKSESTVLDNTALPAESANEEIPPKVGTETATEEKRDEAEEGEVTPSEEPADERKDSQDGDKEGKKKKGKRRRLVIDTSDAGAAEEEEELRTSPIDDEEDEELADDDQSKKRGKKKKKFKSLLDGGGDESGAGMRAAKKRAAELIAKPKTPMAGAQPDKPVTAAPLPSPAARDAKPKPVHPRPSSALGNGVETKKRVKAGVADDQGEAAPAATALIHSDLMTPAAMTALREQWKRVIQQNNLLHPESTVNKAPIVRPPKAQPKQPKPVLLKARSSQAQLYSRPQDAPGWNELEKFASDNHDWLLEAVKKRFILEMNHRKLVLDEYRAITEARKREEELKAARVSELAANAPKHRYPSRNNPAAIAIELGPGHGAAEAERRERERRKNAATLPDLEFGDEYRASVFDRMRRETTDGRPALCAGRQDNGDCVAPGQIVPPLIIPSPLGCNCSRAVTELERKGWSDAERCIFLDKFLQFPKDFKRIASFLTSKTTEDVIAFYYDTKKACDYKSYLNEHYRRRNRDQSELAGVREQYLAKLGVKLPLCPDLDGLRKFPTSAKDAIVSLPVPCTLLSAADVFPKQSAVDIFPHPAILGDFNPGVDAGDIQSFLLRGISAS